MRRFFCALILAAGTVLAVRAAPSAEVKEPVAAWGIDGCLTCHVPVEADFQGYVRLLQETGVTWVRERGAWIDEAALTDGGNQLVRRLRTMRAAGLRVVAFAGGPTLRVEQPGNQLPEDLQAVYAVAFRQGRNAAGLVDAWEMSGEPDVGYCRDLPDRLAAYNKAMYLGLSDGAASAGRSTVVMMGALALAPGPWLERAMKNGLLDYTDAYNFHFYGHASDLAGVIAAHRAVLRAAFPPTGLAARHGRPGAMFPERHRERPRLPLWLTECGINAASPDDFYNPQRRALQAAFARETAGVARAAREMAVFMPFILVWPGDAHAMTVRSDFPLPAWTAYADYVRRHPWPERPLMRAAANPNRVVVQWMPDNTTTVPHKVAGTYRFGEDGPVRGVLRVYNFGGKPVGGRIEAGLLPHVKIISPALVAAGGGRLVSSGLIVPAGGRIELPLEFSPSSPGYFRDEWEAAFVDGGGRRSPVVFGLERWPEAKAFTGAPLALKPTGTAGPWTPLNGLEIKEEGGRTMFQVARLSRDPLLPPQAVAAVEGLPARGFLRLQLSDPKVRVRVDLVDTKGQRFAVWENFGVNYERPSSDVWLSLDDFNLYFWGRCGADARLYPERIREVRLRFFFQKANDPTEARLSFMTEAGPEIGGR
ncbi:MAG: hypothetical protein WC661_16850 [Opitutaceae bacterium]